MSDFIAVSLSLFVDSEFKNVLLVPPSSWVRFIIIELHVQGSSLCIFFLLLVIVNRQDANWMVNVSMPGTGTGSRTKSLLLSSVLKLERDLTQFS